MLSRISLLLATLLCVASVSHASATPGETCTVTGTGTMSGDISGFVLGGTLADDCTDIGGDDDIIVEGTVTVDGDLEFDDTQSPTVGMLVRNGGSVAFAADATSGRIDVILAPGYDDGANSIDVDATASSFAVSGQYRTLGVTPTARDALGDANTEWPTGEVIPCLGWDESDGAWEVDCGGALGDANDRTGSPNEMGFLYRHTEYDTADGSPGDQHVVESLAAVEAGEIACWYDPDTSTPDAPVQDGWCYEITEVTGDYTDASGQDDAGVIWIDVRQTDPSDPQESQYPLARRQVKASTAGADADAGSRDITLGTGVVSADNELIGRFLRIGDGSGLPDSEIAPLIISDSTNDAGGDQFEIADTNGFPVKVASGVAVWIDYGWKRGDPFFVGIPVVFTSGDDNPNPCILCTPSGTNSNRIWLEPGPSHSLQLAVLDDLHKIWIRDDVTGFSMTDTWLRDFGNGNGFGLDLDGWRGSTLTRVSVTGGFSDANPESPAIDCSAVGSGGADDCDRNHPIIVGNADDGRSEPSGTITLRTVKIRHGGDDCFANVTITATYDTERLWCEHRSDSSVDSSLMAGTSSGGCQNGTWKDLGTLAGDVGEPGTFTVCGSATQPGDFTSMSFDGFFVLGGGRPLAGNAYGGISARNFMSINSGVGDLVHSYDRFVFRDVVGEASIKENSTGFRPSLTNGIYQDVTNTSSTDYGVAVEDNLTLLENVLYHNFVGAGSNAILESFGNIDDAGATFTARNLSFVWDAGVDAQWDFIFKISGSADAADLTWDGLLVSNFDDNTVVGALPAFSSIHFFNQQANTTAGPCLFRSDVSGGSEAIYPATTIRDRDPGFISPARGRFDTPAGGVMASQGDIGCGIKRGLQAPGIFEYRYMHAITNLEPEFQGPRGSAGTLPQTPIAAEIHSRLFQAPVTTVTHSRLVDN